MYSFYSVTHLSVQTHSIQIRHPPPPISSLLPSPIKQISNHKTTKKTKPKQINKESSMDLLRVTIKSPTLLAALTCAIMLVMLPQVSAKRYIVGGNMGWATSGVNYTVWASDKHFYLGDWLYFVYDRHQTNVLEVNKTNYENCIADHPKANWTTGAGRDVVPLNQTRHYYFISGNGFCYGGMKLAVHVVKPPPPPSASPVKNASPSTTYRGNIVLPLAFAIGAIWDSFLRVMG